MTGIYEFWSLPQQLEIKCPDCQNKADFEFAELIQIKFKKDIEYFQQHPNFDYQLF